MRRSHFLVGFLFLIPFTAFGREESKLDLATSVSGTQHHPFYGQLELRHHTNSYYDADGYLINQEPTAHIRGRIGGLFYDGMVDAYLTLGLIKGAQTQRISQRRPELEVDFYPFRWSFGRVVQYNIVELPFSDAKYNDKAHVPEMQGSIFTTGISPVLYHGWAGDHLAVRVQAGADWWTELYSREQVRRREPRERDRFELQDDLDNDEFLPAEALQYYSQYMVGVSMVTSWLSFVEAGFSGHFDFEYLPKYSDDGLKQDYTYEMSESSHYRLRLRARLSSRVTFINDYYQYHQGSFGGRQTGADSRRMRNIARLTIQL